jgi:hypothetical protein
VRRLGCEAEVEIVGGEGESGALGVGDVGDGFGWGVFGGWGLVGLGFGWSWGFTVALDDDFAFGGRGVWGLSDCEWGE